MKNKVLAMLFCGMLAVSAAAVPVCAEEDDVVEITYDMIDEDVYEGSWLSAFGVFDVYLPDDWNVLLNADLDEETEDNVYFTAASEDEMMSASISYAPSEFESIEDMYDAMNDAGTYDELYKVVVNDISAIGYVLDDGETHVEGLAALGDQGGVYNLTVGYYSSLGDEGDAYVGNILSSFSATEYEEETE